MSYFQERSASNVMASLKAMMPAQSTVTRDGKPTKVEAHELVPGDLVTLRLGDRWAGWGLGAGWGGLLWSGQWTNRCVTGGCTGLEAGG